MSDEHFQDFVQYLEGLKKSGKIQGYDVVFLNPHGGDLNGFFLIRGEPAQIDAMVAGKEWVTHMMRAGMHLQSSGAVPGVTGSLIMERMQMWSQLIPQ